MGFHAVSTRCERYAYIPSKFLVFSFFFVFFFSAMVSISIGVYLTVRFNCMLCIVQCSSALAWILLKFFSLKRQSKKPSTSYRTQTNFKRHAVRARLTYDLRIYVLKYQVLNVDRARAPHCIYFIRFRWEVLCVIFRVALQTKKKKTLWAEKKGAHSYHFLSWVSCGDGWNNSKLHIESVR